MNEAGNAAPPSFDDRLLAECVRVIERDDRSALDDAAANEAARSSGGDFESRLVTRAHSLPAADEITGTIRQNRTVIGWIVIAGLFVAFVLGAAAARTTMTPIGGTRINFYWVIGGVLGVQSILLVVWFLAAMRWATASRRVSSSAADSPMLASLGRLLITAGYWFGGKLLSGGIRRAVLSATGRIYTTGRLGFWTFSSITHAVWLAFNVGAMALILILLSTRQYTFVWETTILDERHYVTLTEWLSAPARLAGFAVPTDADIAASQWTGETTFSDRPEGASHRWASLLLGSIVLYGFGPRILLLGLSMSMRRAAGRAFRLDVTLPEYERLRSVLTPHAHPLGVVDRDEVRQGTHADACEGIGAPHPVRAPGPPAIVGIEIARPETGWPPRVNGVGWQDLGIVESRDDRDRVIETIKSSETEPNPLVIVSDLTNTPDRGISRALRAVAEQVNRPPVLVLSAGHRLRGRGYDADRVARRIADWREMASRCGIDAGAIVEVDLDRLTDDAAARLKQQLAAVENGAAHETSTRRIESAFALIEQHAHDWSDRTAPPSESEQLALHREIASMYRHRSGAFRSLLTMSPDSPRALLTEIKTGAGRFVDLLPDRLRRSPKWLAAGALAGAFGCVATASLISPIAIAALPSWSAIGAAIAAVVQPAAGGDHNQDALSAHAPDLAQAIRSAALFAVTLELQGRDEAAITRILDRTFSEDESPLSDAASVHRWLESRRDDFDRAVAAGA